MGNKKWTTPEEEMFLEHNVPQYEAAQEAKRVYQWLIDFFLRWFLKFQQYSDGRNTIDSKTVKKVKCTATRLQMRTLTLPSSQRIRHWFNNHTGVRAKSKNKSSIIRVAKIHTSGKAPRDPFAAVVLGGGVRPSKAEAATEASVLRYAAGHVAEVRYRRGVED